MKDVYNNVYHYNEENTNQDNIKGPRRANGLTFNEVIGLPWTKDFNVGILALDWVMFNPNTSLYIYCNLEFTFRTSGKI